MGLPGLSLPLHYHYCQLSFDQRAIGHPSLCSYQSRKLIDNSLFGHILFGLHNCNNSRNEWIWINISPSALFSSLPEHQELGEPKYYLCSINFFGPKVRADIKHYRLIDKLWKFLTNRWCWPHNLSWNICQACQYWSWGGGIFAIFVKMVYSDKTFYTIFNSDLQCFLVFSVHWIEKWIPARRLSKS